MRIEGRLRNVENLKEHIAITKRNKCIRCKINSDFLYNGVCSECLLKMPQNLGDLK